MCCIKCEKRIPGCHSLCEAYIKETEKKKARSNAIYQAKMSEFIPNTVLINASLKSQRKKRVQI